MKENKRSSSPSCNLSLLKITFYNKEVYYGKQRSRVSVNWGLCVNCDLSFHVY